MTKLPDSTIKELERIAHELDKTSPRDMINKIRTYVAEGESVPMHLRELADEFLKLVNVTKYKKKKESLFLEAKRFEKQMKMYQAVIESGLGHHKEEGGAYYEVSKPFCVTPSTVEKAYRKIKKWNSLIGVSQFGIQINR